MRYRVLVPAEPNDAIDGELQPRDAMIYVNCDASYRNGWAGIAYQSDQLESQSRLVECKNNGEAELRALLLAMSAAEQAHLVERCPGIDLGDGYLGQHRVLGESARAHEVQQLPTLDREAR